MSIPTKITSKSKQASKGGNGRKPGSDNAPVVMMVTHAKFWQSGWGSHARISQLIEELSKKYNLIIFFTVYLSPSDREELELCGYNLQYRYLETKNNWIRDITESVVLGSVRDELVCKYFAKAVSEFKPNVCIFEYLRFTYLTDELPSDVMTIIDTHDLISRRQESRTRYEKAELVSREAEIQSLLKYDFIIAIQRTEAAIIETWLGRNNVMYIPICYETNDLTNNKKTIDKSTRIGFLGGASEANISGVKWFFENVWPYFYGSEISTYVAGDVGKSIVKEYSNVQVLGRVNLNEFYESVHFVINPVQWGGGMKIKTVEAMSYGLPVVTTSEGAAGLEEAENLGLLIADDPEIFAFNINELSKNHELCQHQGMAAKKFVDFEFNRVEVFQVLHKVIESTAQATLQNI